MFGKRIRAEDTLTNPDTLTNSGKLGNKIGKQFNGIKLDYSKEKTYFRCVLEEFLPCFSYLVRLYCLPQTVCSLSTFCSLRVIKRHTVYWKPVVLCDLD